MMRSMFTGVSGLRTHQTKMDVIAHNISNVNTVGFKSSRVTFNDVFSQTIQGASRANDDTGRGGTNPMQIGLGVNVASIDKNMSTGAAQRTDRAMDLMIDGDGFFIVSDATGQYFTRAGAFKFDGDGYLVMANGMRVNGWDTNVNGTEINQDLVSPLRIWGEKEYMTPSVTTSVEVRGNLNPDALTILPPVTLPSTISYYDSIGNRWVVDVTYTHTGAGTWTASFAANAYVNGDKTTTGVAVAPTTVPAGNSPIPITFDSNGRLATVAGQAAGVTDMQINFVGTYPDLATVGNITLDFANLTQFSNETSSARFDRMDGNYSGTLEGYSVGPDGIITGRYSNGEYKMLGQIPVAMFQNPAGLEAVGNNLYVITPNSGDFDGRGVTGNMMGGVLEMSNVDLANEFTEMITTQRGFQASSRLITTSDEMLQELVNIKR